MAKKYSRDWRGLWHDASGRFSSGPKRPDLRRYPKARKPPEPPRPKVPEALPPGATPRRHMDRWAGVKERSRRRRVPSVATPRKGRKQIGRFTSKGVTTIGDALLRSGAFEKVQGLKAGTRVRVTVRGKTKEGVRLKARQRRREFDVARWADGTPFRGRDAKADQLLHHAMGALGKEFFDARGRGYDLIDPKDKLEWTVEVIAD